MKKTLLSRVALISLSLFLAKALAAQNVGINDDNSVPDPNAMLDVKSTSKGVLFPRLTTAQRNVLGSANPTEGMLVYDTDVERYYFFVNGAWVQLTAGGSGSVPVGTVLTYAGSITDEIVDGKPKKIEPVTGYLLCNGAEISSVQYPDLANVINNSWGTGGDGDDNTMNLPDLRGMFLRGVSGLRNDGRQDPDTSGRITMLTLPGGNDKNKVGSYQYDAFQGHYHELSLQSRADQDGQGAITAGGTGQIQSLGYNLAVTPISDGTNGTPRTSQESRPKNAYVHYIIKY